MSEPERNVPVVWSRRFRGGRPDHPTLSRYQIVAAARKLLDEEGLDRLSMRRLGTRLESGATSIYWYVANKDELLDLAMDEVLAEVPVPEPTGDWSADLRELVHGFRTMMFAHPWILQLLATRPARGPHALRYAEAQLSLLSFAGFADDELDGAFRMIGDYVVGSVTADGVWSMHLDGASRSGIDWAALGTHLQAVATPLPVLRRYSEYLQGEERAFLLTRRFDFGLGVLLDGLAQRLKGRTSA